MKKLNAILFSLVLATSYFAGFAGAEEFTSTTIISDKSFFDPSIGFKEQAAPPANVISDYGQIYVGTDNLPYYQNDSGVSAKIPLAGGDVTFSDIIADTINVGELIIDRFVEGDITLNGNDPSIIFDTLTKFH